MGIMLDKFLKFHASNSNEKNVNNICFLIKLGPENVNLTSSQISILKDGVFKTSVFEPPTQLLTKNMKEHIRGFDYYKTKISWDIGNKFVTGCIAEISYYSLVGDSLQLITNLQYFVIEDMKKEVDIKITALEPNYGYILVFYLVTPYGRGQGSKKIDVQTLICDPPAQVKQIHSTDSSITVSWDKPIQIAKNATLKNIVVEILYIDENVIGDQVRKLPIQPIEKPPNDFPMTLKIERLEAGKKYIFRVKVKDNEVLDSLTNQNDHVFYIENGHNTEWVTIPVRTLPAKLENFNLLNITSYSAALTWDKYGDIADGEFLHYLISYNETKDNSSTVRFILTSVIVVINYNRVHIILDEVFSKILKKPSIVQK